MPHFQISPGNTLDYEFIEPGEAGFTFVFVNALTGDKAVWADTIVPELTGAGHGALLFNLRGQAGTEFTFTDLDEATIVADIVALMDQITPPRPVYVGHSIGGLFAAKAHLAGRVASGLVFINTLRKAGPRLDWLNDACVRMAEVGGLELLRDLYIPLLFNQDWQGQNREAFLKSASYKPIDESDGAYLLLKAATTADWNLSYESLDVPVLNISGLQDRVFYDAVDVGELLVRLPNARAIVMDDAGHMIPVEQPVRLASALLSFGEELRAV